MDAAKLFTDVGCKFDMVWIDGDHRYESVKADLLAWTPLLVPDGLLCGHDRAYHPVERAVRELVGPVSFDHGIWYKEMS